MARSPNFLFLFPDQHRADWLGTNPDLPLRTPNIDALAARGTAFSRCYTPSPVCAPARACLACGRHYENCGVPNNHYNFPLDYPTYYRALRDAGYRVAGVGKFDLHKDTSNPENLFWGLDGRRDIEEWGFTEGIDNEGKIDGSNSYRKHGGPRGPYLKFLADRGLADTYVAEHGDPAHESGAYVTALPDDAYCDNWLTDNGLHFLESFPADQPWHLVVNFTGPHSPMDVTAGMLEGWEDVDIPPPHNPADEHPEWTARKRLHYAEMIANIDRNVGRLIDAVAARGELDNTVIVYASDHGEMLGDHARWGKVIWREASVRVPLIVAGPGIRAGETSEALVSLHDLAATFLDYADCERLPAMEAISLAPLLAGKRHRHRDYLRAGLYDWRLAFDGRWKLILDDDETYLFDLDEDPWEDDNIAAHHPDIVARLRPLARPPASGI